MKPFQPSGSRSSFSFSFTLTLLVAHLLQSGVATAAPSINLSKKSGPPTTRILVSGRGFEANVGVDIFFDSTDEALIVTNGKGEFTAAEIGAPRSALPGEHWVTALERNNNEGAQVPFLVQTNWSQFHFDADGTRLNPYENVLRPSNVSGIGLLWNYSIGTEVNSDPAVADGVVYVSADNILYALNAATGAKLWTYTTATSSFLSDAALADGVVYIGSTDNNVYALDAVTGAKLWSYATGSGAGSPTVAKGVVYVGCGDSLCALNAATGAKLWSCTIGSFVGLAAVGKGVVYVGSGDHNVYALNAASGAKLWNYATGDVVYPSPTVANGVVYIGSNDHNVYALNAISGAKFWSYTTGSAVQSSPAVADGVVYIGSQDHNVYALSASTGAKLWSYTTGDIVDSSPALANGVVYVGSQDARLYALNAATGAKLWTYEGAIGVFSSPAVANGMVYVGAADNNMYSFGLVKNGGPAEAAQRPDPRTLRSDYDLKASGAASRY